MESNVVVTYAMNDTLLEQKQYVRLRRQLFKSNCSRPNLTESTFGFNTDTEDTG